MTLSGIKIVTIPNKGRGIVATKDLIPGDLICESEAVSLIITENHMGNCCENCLSVTKCMPCVECKSAYYCSEVCRAALAPKHELECLPLCRLIPNKCPQVVRQALQCLIYTSTTDDKVFFSFHGELEGKSEAVRSKLLEYGRMLRWMLQDDYFPEMTIEDLAGHVSKISKNALIVETIDSSTGLSLQVGGGMFFEFLTLNHQCLPNSEALSLGRSVRVVATQYVPAGAEISTRYTEGGSFGFRKQAIERHQFLCDCNMCLPYQPHHAVHAPVAVSVALKAKESNTVSPLVADDSLSTHAPSVSGESATTLVNHVASPVFAAQWYEGLLCGQWCLSCCNSTTLPACVSAAVSHLRQRTLFTAESTVNWVTSFEEIVVPFYLPTPHHASFSHPPPLISFITEMCCRCGVAPSEPVCPQFTSHDEIVDFMVDSADLNTSIPQWQEKLVKLTKDIIYNYLPHDDACSYLSVGDGILLPVIVHLSSLFEKGIVDASSTNHQKYELHETYMSLLHLWTRADMIVYPYELSRLRGLLAMSRHVSSLSTDFNLTKWLRERVLQSGGKGVPQFGTLFSEDS